MIKLEDMIKIGIGSIFLAKEKVEEFINEAQKRGELTEKEAKELIDELKTTSEEKLSQIKQLIENEVKKELNEIGVATKDDIKRLEKEIEELKKLILNSKKEFE